MIELHHLNNSRSQRVIWLLEELSLNYTIVVHERDEKTRQASASLRQIHPLGKAPVIIDKGQVMAETGAIFNYLLETYGGGRLQPETNTPMRAQYLYWMSFSEGSFMPYLAMKLVFQRIVERSPFFARPLMSVIFNKVNRGYLNPALRSEIDFIERHLSQQHWFAGDQFTAADILIGFLMEAVCDRLAPKDKYPFIADFVRRIGARPAYNKAMEKGGWSTAEFDRYWANIK